MSMKNVDAEISINQISLVTTSHLYIITSALTLSEGLVNRVSSLTQKSIEH